MSLVATIVPNLPTGGSGFTQIDKAGQFFKSSDIGRPHLKVFSWIPATWNSSIVLLKFLLREVFNFTLVAIFQRTDCYVAPITCYASLQQEPKFNPE